MKETVEYKGYTIIADSYKDDETNKWVPSANIIPLDESQNTETPMSWEREFDTVEEANNFALEGAHFYIDNHF